MRDTFCILPWKQLLVRTNGATHVCNRVKGYLSHRNGVFSIQRHPLEKIWNCDELIDMRRQMMTGELVPSCSECYDLEDAGSTSLRQSKNADWAAGYLNECGDNRATVAASSGENGYTADAPSFLQLDVGSLCNLRCRMCNSGASSAINSDPVHRSWSGEGLSLSAQRDAWFRQESAIVNVLSKARQLRQLHIIGGEPLLVKEIGPILQLLIDTNVAPSVELSLHTNATVNHCEWLQLTDAFKKLELWFSIDGFEQYYEYIRYPAKWKTLIANIAVLRALPKAHSAVHIVFQIYNALNIVMLFRELDHIDLPFFPHVLYEPTYLRAVNMPIAARAAAATRIESYTEVECQSRNKSRVASLASYLRNSTSACTLESIRDFMLFTNDLDLSRNQRFHETHAELAAFLREAGSDWIEENRHCNIAPTK